MEIFTTNAQDTQTVGQNIGTHIVKKGIGTSAKTITLYGELGSGKTTFVQGFAKGIGLLPRIISPTFIIMRKYELKLNSFKNLYHLDLYRIQQPKDIENLGLAEIFASPKNIVVIEWAERLESLIPKKRIDITFKQTDENRRQIVIREE